MWVGTSFRQAWPTGQGIDWRDLLILSIVELSGRMCCALASPRLPVDGEGPSCSNLPALVRMRHSSCFLNVVREKWLQVYAGEVATSWLKHTQAVFFITISCPCYTDVWELVATSRLVLHHHKACSKRVFWTTVLTFCLNLERVHKWFCRH